MITFQDYCKLRKGNKVQHNDLGTFEILNFTKLYQGESFMRVDLMHIDNKNVLKDAYIYESINWHIV